MTVLTRNVKGAGEPAYANVLRRLIPHLLKSPATVQRGLNLLAGLAPMSVVTAVLPLLLPLLPLPLLDTGHKAL